MLLSSISHSSPLFLLCVAIVSAIVGYGAMALYQWAISWRLRRFLRKNCAACMTPNVGAPVAHAHPIVPGESSR